MQAVDLFQTGRLNPMARAIGMSLRGLSSLILVPSIPAATLHGLRAYNASTGYGKSASSSDSPEFRSFTNYHQTFKDPWYRVLSADGMKIYREAYPCC